MVWWKCQKCSYEWKAKIADRTGGHGCPVCSGEKLVAGMNDLQTAYPDIAAEWSEQNGTHKPSEVWPKSRQSVWWHCAKCGKEWKGVIYSRVRWRGCPYCSRKSKEAEKSEIINGEKAFKLMRSVIEETGIRYTENDDTLIGIPLQFYFPDKKGAIEIMFPEKRKGRKGRGWENAKNWLCLKSGIKLVRIIGKRRKGFDNCICISCDDNKEDTFMFAAAMAFKMIVG